MSWARDAVGAIRKIVLIEARMEGLTGRVKHLADTYLGLDRRLVRLEAKFDLLESMATPRRRAIPAKTARSKSSKRSG